MKNKIFSILVGFVFGLGVFFTNDTLIVFAETRINSDITESQVWSSENGPYIISQPVIVNEGVALTVEKGSILKFNQGGLIIVNGEVKLEGEESNRIYVTAYENDVLGGDSNSADEQPSEYVDGDGNIVSIPGQIIEPQEGSFHAFEVLGTGSITLKNIDASYYSILVSLFDSANAIVRNVLGSHSGGHELFRLSGGTLNAEGNLIVDGGIVLFLDTAKVAINNALIRNVEPLNEPIAFNVARGELLISSTTIAGFDVGIKSNRSYSIFLNRILFDSNTVAIEQNSYKPIFQVLTPSFLKKIFTYFIPTVFADVEDVFTIRNSFFRNNGQGIINKDAICHSDPGQECEYYASFMPDIDAKNNFWGDETGPKIDLNTTGGGDTVSVGVIFSDWLTENPLEQKCCSSVMFIPGIEGSRLFRQETFSENQLWIPNDISDPALLSMDPSGKSIIDVYTKAGSEEGVIDRVTPLFPVYHSFIKSMNLMKSDGLINDWVPVAYDWRLSPEDVVNNGNLLSGKLSYLNPVSDPYIISEVKRLASTSKTGRVTIIAHSNGGLITKALVKRLGELGLEDKIDRVILVAVPQLGTPHAIGALLHGFKQDIRFVLSAEQARSMMKNMPGAYNLLPSEKYFQSVSSPVVTFDNSDTFLLDRLNFGPAITSRFNLFNFLSDSRRQKDVSVLDLITPSVLNNTLLNSSYSIHETLDNWRFPRSINVVQIAGWGIDTVSGIAYTDDGSKCSEGNICASKRGKKYTPILTEDGDGVVVVPSALALSTSTENVESYWANIPKLTKGKNDLDHKIILENNELQRFIKNKITNSPSVVEFISTSSPVVAGSLKKLTYFLHSPLTLELYDEQGRHTGISPTTGLVENEIPATEYREFGEVKYITNSSNMPVKVVMNGQSSGSFTFDIQETLGNTVVASTTFVGVPSSTSTVATMSMEDTLLSATPLLIDKDGDGDTDMTLVPGGIVLADIIPPQVKFLNTLESQFVRSQKMVVSATSSDNVGIASTTILFAGRDVGNPARVDLFYEPLGTSTLKALAVDTFGNIASTSHDIRVIATATSTISDIERAYSLGWIFTKNAKKELISKVKEIVRVEKRIVEIERKVGNKKVKERIERMEEVLDKKITKALLVELKLYKKVKMNDKAYQLIKEDLEWILNN